MISRIVSGLALALSLGVLLFMSVNANAAPAHTSTAASIIQSELVIDDFESGLPAGWFQYGDYGSGTAIATNPVAASTIPGLPAANHALEIAYTSAGWGAGTGRNLGGQDWSSYDGLAFWFSGTGSGVTYRLILSDNLNPNVPGDTAERFAYEFTDTIAGWQLISIPWANFFRDYAYQPPGAPDDGLTLTAMQAYALALPAGSRVAMLDQVALFSEGEIAVKVAYASAAYQTVEGSSALISVTLNAAAALPVTVTYTTVDGTALAGTDYTAVTGQLVFAPGSTLETFSVTTLDNAYNDDERTVLLGLSNPVNALLGPRSSATLVIADDEISMPAGCRSISVDTFESGQLPSGVDSNGLGVGFVTWNATGASVVITTTTTPPAPVPGGAAGNHVLSEALTIGSGQWAGFTHAFSNAAVNEWTPQDWSRYVGLSLWLYGHNTGGTLFIDVLDNRNPGSTSDDAERWSVDIPDDFNGWQYFEIPWADFHRKDIGNGAPNDGFTLSEIYGYGIGGYGNVDMGSHTYYADEVGVLLRLTAVDTFESGQLPSGVDSNGLGVGFVTWNATGASVAITTTTTPPAPVPGTAAGNHVLSEALTIGSGQWAGFTHAFSNAAVNEWTPQDWSSYQGMCLWLYGHNTGGTLFIDVLDNRNPGSTSDDAERWSVDIADDFSGWQLFRFVWADFHRKDIGNGAPNDGFTLSEIYGYGIGGYGNVDMGSHTYYADEVTIFGDTGTVEQPLKVEFAASSFEVMEGETATITVTLNVSATTPVSVTYRTAEGYAVPARDYVPADGVLVFAPGQLTQSFAVATLPNSKAEGNRGLMLNLHTPINAAAGFQMRAMLTILDDDQPDPALLDDFEGYHLFNKINNATLNTSEIAAGAPMALPGQGAYEQVLTATYGAGGSGTPSMTRVLPAAQDWSAYNNLKFWYYGNNSNQQITVQVLDNQTTTTAQTSPADWQLVWSDEFNATTGTAPNVNVWRNEIGDGSLNGIAGWGNSELEYYTAGAHNAAADGNGNLAITLDQIAPDSGLLCWYGPCEYSSARLVSAKRIETQYGRVEARIRVPDGAAGLWPAFWMLGSNIDEVGWPQSGEIDIMEYVSRNPNEVFGTLHGPGYSGGAAIGHIHTFPQPVAQSYHTFAVEWSPDEIHWYVDGINYHNVSAAGVAPNQWVFNHPFYLILNLAVGGNFGGTISPDLTFPQQMLVDYVRVYQAVNASERFVTSFTDNFSGWREISLPFSTFTRGAEQPVGAPNDGFGLHNVWGYGFSLPAGSNGTLHLDQVRLARTPQIHRSRRFNVDQDTFLNGAQPGTVYGNAQTMWAGFFGLMRPLVHVPVSGIPADAAVDAAYLYLYVTEGRGFTQWSDSVISDVAAHTVVTPWLADSANWATPWAMAGGDYGPALDAIHLGSGKLNTWLRLDVTAAVQDIVRDGENNGFLITANDDHGVRYALATQNYWDPSKIGYVRVYYRTIE